MTGDTAKSELAKSRPAGAWRQGSARRKARKRALDILYESDIRDCDPREVVQFRQERDEPPVAAYTAELVEGVCASRARIDELLSTYAQGWTLSRMAAVDRNILRIGVYELMWRDDVPDPVAIDEAVSLAKELSTEESPNFVNGLLGRLQLVKEL
ncbi:MAG: transcription antitermination factor NusB [Mycobacteriales bacterium]